jgi:uncharacterized delta-60 repeat protein
MNIRMSSRAAALFIAALIIPFNISNRGGVLAQDLEPHDAPGDLDTSFGNGGRVSATPPGVQTFCRALALQRDGKLLAAGYNTVGDSDFVVCRFNPDGSLDSSFGSGGTVRTDFFGSNDNATAVAVQHDGRIVVAGSALRGSTQDTRDFVLVRYNTDGSLDSTFGTDGKVATDISGHADFATSLAIQPDGRIVAAGRGYNPSVDESGDFELVRYDPDGSLDTTFGTAGKVVTDFFGHPDELNAIALQNNGKILAAGSASLMPDEEMEQVALARYNADGSLDQSFGNGGKVATEVTGQEARANTMTLANDGNILVAGLTFKSGAFGNSDFVLLKYSSAGVLDATFGTGGKVITDFAGYQDIAMGVAQQADGKILVGGQTQTGASFDTEDFGLARYNADGSLDSGFGANGRTGTDFFGLADVANAMVVQQDGKVVLGGYSSGSASTRGSTMALARYTTGAAAATGFTLAFDQSPVTVERGAKATIHVLINRTGGFTGNVTITPPDGSEIGLRVKPGDAVSTSDDSVKFKLKIKGGATPGHFDLTFTGRDDSGRTVSATIGVTVQ